jgi:hypothetical protein
VPPLSRRLVQPEQSVVFKGEIMMSRQILVGAVATAFSLIGATGVATAGDDATIKNGSCSGAAVWKLKAKPDDGRLEVEGEVDTNRTGQTWKWRILHNGKVAKHGTAQTTGRSGSFSIERRVGNAPGVDMISWRAVNPASGQTCRGSVRI